MKKFLSVLILLGVLLSLLASCGHRHEYVEGKCTECGADDPVYASRYLRVLDLIEAGDYTTAYSLLGELGDYRDAGEMLTRFRFVPTKVVQDTAGGILESVYSYGESNLPIGIFTTRYSGTDALVDRITDYVYDTSGRITKKTVTSDGEIESVCDYEYGADGRMTRMTETSASGQETVTEHEYDGRGSLVKAVRNYPDGSVYTAEYTYDDMGRPTGKYYIGSSSMSTLSYEYVYDARGNLITEINEHPYYGDGGRFVTNYTYDEKGVLTRKMETHEGAGSTVTEYEYDGAGRLLREVSDSSVRTYTYDEDGNRVKEVYAPTEGDGYVIEYAYDAYGNLIRRVYTGDDGGSETIECDYRFVYIPSEIPEEIEALFRVFE